MTIKECIDIVDNLKPNQYSVKEKVMWLSFIDEIIINEVLKTHEGYDGRYDDFSGYSEDKLSVPLIVKSPYDRLYTAYLKMKIDGENGETARYNNSAALFNSYLMEYRKFYHKTHTPLDATKNKPVAKNESVSNVTDAIAENIKREVYALLCEDLSQMTSKDKLYDIVNEFVINNIQMLKGRDGVDGKDGKDGRDGVDVDLTEYVKNTDYATGTKAGVVKVPDYSGLSVSAGSLTVVAAKDEDLLNKYNNYKPLTSRTIDSVVKIGITTNKKALTDEEKASACAWLGVNDLVGDIETSLDRIIEIQNSLIGGDE